MLVIGVWMHLSYHYFLSFLGMVTSDTRLTFSLNDPFSIREVCS